MKKLILIFIIALFLVAGVFAVNPHTVQTSSTGFSIIYPKNDVFKLNTNITLNFHVFNSTNMPVRNNTASCAFHLYNSTGSHIIETGVIMNSNNIDWEISITQFNFTGRYPYLFQCNNTIEGGFVSDFITITPGGIAETSSTGAGTILGIIILFAIVIFFTIMYIYQSDFTVKWIFFLLAFLFITITVNVISLVIYNESGDANIKIFFDKFGATTYYMIYFVAGLVIIFWLFKMIMTLYDAKIRRDTAKVGAEFHY